MLLGGLIIVLVIGSAIFLFVYRRPQPEPPEGATIIRRDSAWNYILDDQRGMFSTGYLTRGAAIRAATAELERLQRKDAQR